MNAKVIALRLVIRKSLLGRRGRMPAGKMTPAFYGDVGDWTSFIESAAAEKQPAERQGRDRRLISHPYCVSCPAPHFKAKASCDLSESCPQNGDTPKSPLSIGGSAGAVGRHIHTLSRVELGWMLSAQASAAAGFVPRPPL